MGTRSGKKISFSPTKDKRRSHEEKSNIKIKSKGIHSIII